METRSILIILLMILVGTTYGEDTEGEVTINTGTLIQNVGTVKLIENIVIIKKNLSELDVCQEKAQTMLINVKNLLKKENDSEVIALLNNVKEKLTQLTGFKSKRSLLPFVGTIMHDLFGVAKESDLIKERERLDKIESWANQYGHVINNVISTLNDQAENLNAINHELKELEDKIELEINNLDKRVRIQNIVTEINVNIQEILSLRESVRKAHFGHVDINLITVAELKEIIHYSILEFNFQPLDIDIISYYSMLNVKIIDKMLYILLPFNNEETLTVKKIIPFPMKVKDKTIKMVGREELILENKLNLMTIWQNEVLKDNCLQIKELKYFCNFPNFYLQPLDLNPCIKFQLQGGIDHCNYENLDINFEVKFLKNIYIYLKEKQVAEITCKNKVEKLEIENVKVLPSHCKIKIHNIFYYQPTIFKSVDLNITKNLLSLDFDLKLKNFKVEHHQIKMKLLPPYENPFMIIYKQNVMPWMTLMFVPVITIVCLIFFCGVKILVLKKINLLNLWLKKHLDDGKE